MENQEAQYIYTEKQMLEMMISSKTEQLINLHQMSTILDDQVSELKKKLSELSNNSNKRRLSTSNPATDNEAKKLKEELYGEIAPVAQPFSLPSTVSFEIKNETPVINLNLFESQQESQTLQFPSSNNEVVDFSQPPPPIPTSFNVLNELQSMSDNLSKTLMNEKVSLVETQSSETQPVQTQSSETQPVKTQSSETPSLDIKITSATTCYQSKITKNKLNNRTNKLLKRDHMRDLNLDMKRAFEPIEWDTKEGQEEFIKQFSFQYQNSICWSMNQLNRILQVDVEKLKSFVKTRVDSHGMLDIRTLDMMSDREIHANLYSELFEDVANILLYQIIEVHQHTEDFYKSVDQRQEPNLITAMFPCIESSLNAVFSLSNLDIEYSKWKDNDILMFAGKKRLCHYPTPKFETFSQVLSLNHVYERNNWFRTICEMFRNSEHHANLHENLAKIRDSYNDHGNFPIFFIKIQREMIKYNIQGNILYPAAMFQPRRGKTTQITSPTEPIQGVCNYLKMNFFLAIRNKQCFELGDKTQEIVESLYNGEYQVENKYSRNRIPCRKAGLSYWKNNLSGVKYSVE